MPEIEWVWRGRYKDVYHTDRDCPQLSQTVKPRPAKLRRSTAEAWGFSLCKQCSGEASNSAMIGTDAYADDGV